MKGTAPQMTPRFDFASDNCSGVCPAAWQAMERANAGFSASYGDDAWTARVSAVLRDVFECDCEVFFVFNGTAANSLSLATLCQPYHSIYTHEHAHIETSECGGPEFFSSGAKLLVVGGADGKLDLAALERAARQRTDIHFPKPAAISITQPTELGAVYYIDEMQELGELKKSLGLRLHVDGARLANAIVALGASPSEITWKVGVDVVCLGGTKNGLAVGECVVFFQRQLAAEFAYRCKQAGQLASKMRYLSAPWLGLLENGVWLDNARHANGMADRLAKQLSQLPGVKIVGEPSTNSVFVQFPEGVAGRLRAVGWEFYDFIGAGGSRLMCSWNTTADAVDEFCAAVERCLEIS